MPHIVVTIDDTVLLDGDPGEWSTDRDLLSQLTPGAKPDEPWMQFIGTAMITEGVLKGRDISISVTTRGSGWTMRVDKGGVIDAEIVECTTDH